MKTVVAPRKISADNAGVQCNVPLFLQENSAAMVKYAEEQVAHHTLMLEYYQRELGILTRLAERAREYLALDTERKEALRDK